MHAFNSTMFSCQTVNFLTNGILFTFFIANQKAKKAIDNARIILNKIHLALFTASLRHLFPTFIPGISPLWGLVIVKNKLKSVFLCVCPLIEDKFHHNIVKVYCGTTRLRLIVVPQPL